MGLGKVIDSAVDLSKSWGRTMKANGTVERKIARDIASSKNVSKNMGKVMKEGSSAEAKVAEEMKGYADKASSTGKSTYREVKGMNSTSDKFKAYRQMNRNAIGGGKDLTTMQKVMADTSTVGGLTKEYFTGGTAKQNAIRMSTVGAGYMGVNLAGRGLTGGTLTKNNKGERDIAGIPFI